jgi:hypothetical protein
MPEHLLHGDGRFHGLEVNELILGHGILLSGFKWRIRIGAHAPGIHLQ